MTEIFADVFGTWVELGGSVALTTSQSTIWGPNSFINKGVRGAPRVSGTPGNLAGDYSPHLAGMNRTNSATTPIKSSITAGYSVDTNQVPPLYRIEREDHPRVPVWVYKEDPTRSPKDAAGNYLPDSWPSGQTWTGSQSVYPGSQQAYCLSVPVPIGPDGTPFETYYNKGMEGTTSDRQICIYDPFHDEYFEFWEWYSLKVDGTARSQRTKRQPPTGYTLPADGYYYTCAQPGYIGPLLSTSVASGDPVCTYHGRLVNGSLPDGSNPCTTATGIALAAGTVTMDDLMRGIAPHMLMCSIAEGWSHILPAYNDDLTPHRTLLTTVATGGADFTLQVPEGMICALDPNYTLPPVGTRISTNTGSPYFLSSEGLGTNSTQLVTEFHRIVWAALRDFGVIVSDFGSNTYQLEPTQAFGTQYSKWKVSDYTALRSQIGLSTGFFTGPGNPWGTAPWAALQQIKYPF